MPSLTLLAAATLAVASPAAAQSPGVSFGSVPGSVSFSPQPGSAVPYGGVPEAPSAPLAGPANFATAAAQPLYPDAELRQAAPVAAPRLLEGGQIVARIAGEIVLACDVSEGIEETLAANRDRFPPEQLEVVRLMLMKRNLDQIVDTKLLYAEARRTIPKENYAKIEEQIEKQFEQDRLPQLYKATKTTTRSELEAKLQEIGSSLERQKRAYGERLLAQQWLRQNIELDEEISHAEMLAYYQEHLAEYEFEAKARWEELAVRYDRYRDKAEAYRTIAEMGNAIWRGTALADIAKEKSDGPTASDGGQYDWTTRGSLVSQDLNRAIFTLPVGQLSPIIASETAFHIVRVLERRDAGRTSFVEAQVEIKKKLKQERRDKQIEQYMAKLRQESRVWSIFDNHPQLSKLQNGPSQQ